MEDHPFTRTRGIRPPCHAPVPMRALIMLDGAEANGSKSMLFPRHDTREQHG